ncbi:ABC transporter permease [Isoptericola variabilis]|uniref:ABC-type transporter, integral membrane subunit n=1 Tax=Isoptericola variabilis (strain 225) TaxID=743718 RepID=F6FPJ1_ISOV2|nr:ABC transporter permease [Isoptericola variabilis]AEG43704.1 ABC-type transporter, integral membrane subunit [Isoptericola variabilis 225]TWH27384.1 peptide/nickel transport system permease protein [Isoptericola variabilis J7]
MLKFILRRLGISALILWLASILIFVLTINSGDPLADLRESNAQNRDQLIAARIATMGLDKPWHERYLEWLTGVGGCFTGSCDLGTTMNGSNVLDLTTQAAASTLRLVTLATLLAIVVGVALGMLTAIRQYSGFDYAVTFMSFLFFSLPVFWAAVLLKEYGAIRFNDWIAGGQAAPAAILLLAAVVAVVLAALLGGTQRRRLVTGAATFVFVGIVLFVLNVLDWYRSPVFGLGLVLLTALGAGVLTTALVTGFGNRRVLYAAATTAVVGTLSYLLFIDLLLEPTWLLLAGLFVLAVVVSVAIGAAWGGYARKQAMLVSGITGVVTSLVIVFDILVAHWSGFLALKPRPISTIGSQTPNFTGDFWESVLDMGAQIVLPTVVLTLISIASYSRYTRSSMLEVMNQDYVRTARSKGLSERAVITKHAFRNALIPITTIVAFDFAGLIGGAVITERVFGWKGMGAMFADGLHHVDPAPVMAFFLVTGTAAVVMNMLADIAYAFLDPRIRR